MPQPPRCLWSSTMAGPDPRPTRANAPACEAPRACRLNRVHAQGETACVRVVRATNSCLCTVPWGAELSGAVVSCRRPTPCGAWATQKARPCSDGVSGARVSLHCLLPRGSCTCLLQRGGNGGNPGEPAHCIHAQPEHRYLQ